jgi:hypothetical protein
MRNKQELNEEDATIILRILLATGGWGYNYQQDVKQRRKRI